jgi:autoinducer 2-degrading protein
MHVTLVHVHVKPGSVEAFIEARRNNHENSVREPGNLRFDVLQDPQDPARFILYEAYADADAAKAHKDTAHYLAWRETVAEMMVEPRQGLPYLGLFPQVGG